MSSVTSSVDRCQDQFAELLPVMTRQLDYLFRRRRRQEREELVAEATAQAWSAWRAKIDRGQDPTEITATGLACWAYRYVKRGSRMARSSTAAGGRHKMDIHNPKAGIEVILAGEFSEFYFEGV